MATTTSTTKSKGDAPQGRPPDRPASSGGGHRRRMTMWGAVAAALLIFVLGILIGRQGGGSPGDSPGGSLGGRPEGGRGPAVAGEHSSTGEHVSAGDDGAVTGAGAAVAADAADPSGADEVTWTCSMHPQIQQPNPGDCPLCGMDLIPAESGGEHERGARELTLGPYARKLAEVETAPVERRFVTREVRMVGKVAFDETRLSRISAWMPGRIERLYVDYTGIPVREGEHLLELYSPDLITAQEELIQARRSAESVSEGASEGASDRVSEGASERASRSAPARSVMRANLEAAREKLRLLGLSDSRIEELERRERPRQTVTVNAPMAGIVVEMQAVTGRYVDTGTPLYTIADLSHLWVMLDAYERDLSWIRYGQQVELTTEAYPGESFTGMIVFIDPVVDPRTRTIGVRVHVDNQSGKLKPDMFVRAKVHAELSEDGLVRQLDLAGKWISPMHPEIIKDEPGTCDVCGMPLVRAEDLGYVEGGDLEAPLVIPASAALVTGERAIVYVADPNEEGRFEGREIVLGPRAGDHYLVREGLAEGEEVVTRGNFKIDSAIQIVAGPSMMNPPEEGEDAAGGGGPGRPGSSGGAPGDGNLTEMERAATREPLDVPASFRESLTPLYDAYFAMQTALSLDDHGDAVEGAEHLLEAAASVDRGGLSDRAATQWRADRRSLEEVGRRLVETEQIEPARRMFEPLSGLVSGLVRSYGSSEDTPILRYHCPMAFDWKGADWLQNRGGTENPYFGSAMYKCGTEEETLWPAPEGAGGTDTNRDGHGQGGTPHDH